MFSNFLSSFLSRKPWNLYIPLGILLILSMEGCLRQQTLPKKEVNYSLLRYASLGEEKNVNQFPDFSYAGYEQNARAIPLVPVKATVAPGPGDDGTRIQDAINRVSDLPLKNGFRGAVLLKAGKYEVAQILQIKASGVVLRGEGQGEKGTILTATSRQSWEKHIPLIAIQGKAMRIKEAGPRSAILTDIPVGASSIPVEDATGFHIGDTVEIRKMVNEDWIDFLGMGQYGWTPSLYQMAYRRIVEGIKEDTLFINIPMVDAVDQQYGGGYVAIISLPGRIAHCGVENMRLKSVYSSEDDEMHAYSAVNLIRTVNSWVRNVTAMYFVYSCVDITNYSDFNTIQDCAMLDPKAKRTGMRMYSFSIRDNGGMGNLFQRCFSRNSRHDFVVNARVTGPNVFLDCYEENSGDPSGPHQRWATGTLFDNIKGGRMEANNARGRGTGHGWVGAQTLFWNCEASYMDVASPPGAINWAIGCKSSGTAGGDGYWFSPGTPVRPRSLFLSQLNDRVGAAAVNRVTIPSQRKKINLWRALGRWAGSEKALKQFPE